MLSKMPTDARPVRMLAMACCKSDSTLSMRVLEWVSSSLMFLKVWFAGACGSGFIEGSQNQGADGFAHRHTHYIAVHGQIENYDGQLVVAAHGDGGGIHHAQISRQDVGVSDFLEAHGVGVLQRVFVVD